MAEDELTTGQAAELMGVSRSSLVRYVRSGLLPARRLPGGHLRIRRADVERLRQQGREDVEQDRR